MNREEIEAKKPEDRTAEEQAFLDQAIAAEQADNSDDEAGDDSAVSEEAVKALVQASMSELINKQMEKLSTEIAEKFAGNVKTQRAKALTGAKKTVEKGRDETREFLKALFDGDKQVLKAMDTGTSTNPKAGYLIPASLQNEILRIASDQYGLARREFRYLPFTGAGNSRTIPRLGSSVSVYWTNEGAKKTSTQPNFELVTQTLKKLAAIVPFTDELLEDSGINLTQLVAELFAEAVAKEEDLQFFNGTGSPWTGIFNASGTNTFALGVGEDAGDLTVEDFQAMIDATPSSALAGSKFYMHRTMLSKARLMKDGNGAYVFIGGINGQGQTLLGYPVETSDIFPAVTDITAGEPMALFGNLKQAAIFGDKQQMRVKLLDQATITDTDGTTAINLAEQDMSAIRIVERVGYVLAQPKAVTILKAGAAS